MDAAEAQRQYQATLEARRRLRDHVGSNVSFEDELAAADDDVRQAADVRDRAWLAVQR